MEGGRDSSGTENNGGGGGGNVNRDQFLKSLNKVSHKISKPTRKIAAFDGHQVQQMRPPALAPMHQPPVYNIKMSEFRDVVQQLTGSHAHNRVSPPPPIQPPKQPSSRLQRIRPPPLPQITSRPPTLMDNVIMPPVAQSAGGGGGGGGGGGFLTSLRPSSSLTPLSPLPPLPPVYTVADSPISAYIRYFLQDSVSMISPKWNTETNNFNPDIQPNAPAPPPLPSPSSMLIPPFSPLPFGCLSPMSPYSLHSPGQLGFPHFPPSFT